MCGSLDVVVLLCTASPHKKKLLGKKNNIIYFKKEVHNSNPLWHTLSSYNQSYTIEDILYCASL